ncbi:MAG: BrnA antitoxin family protein [Chthoniobacterales bacterium]
MRKLTRNQKRDIAAIAAKKDADIDFSDAPRVIDWTNAEVGKFYRPAKRPVTIRLDVDIIEWLQSDGRGYQTKANWLLRHAMLHFTNRKPAVREKLTRESGKSGERRRKK